MLLIIIILICLISFGGYSFFYGFPINQKNLIEKVENYLIKQGEKKENFKSFKVNYHFKSGYYVDVIYKDELNVVYSYRYIKNDKGKKRVFIYHSRLIDDTNEDTYQYKHRHVGEF